MRIYPVTSNTIRPSASTISCVDMKWQRLSHGRTLSVQHLNADLFDELYTIYHSDSNWRTIESVQ